MVFGFVIILTLQINPRNGGRMQKSIIIGTHTFHDTFSHLSAIEPCFFLPYSITNKTKEVHTMPQSNDQSYCTCPNVACPRHGDCKACVLYHRDEMKNLPFCFRAMAELKKEEEA